MADEYDLENQDNSLEEEFQQEKISKTSPAIDIASIPEYQIYTKGKQDAEAQLAKLQEALSRRLEMPFNPVMMKMAAGFLAPTKSGSFGESLGYAASSGAEEAEKERSRKVDVEKLQSELIKQQQAIKMKNAAMAVLNKGMSGQLGVAGGASSAPTASPVGVPPSAPTQNGRPTDLMPPNQVAELAVKNPSVLNEVTITPEIIQALAMIGDKDVLNMAVAMQKSQTSRANLMLQEKKIEQGEYDAVQVAHPYDRTDPNRYPVPKILLPAYYKLLAEAQATGDTSKIDQFMARVGVPGFVGKVSTSASDAGNKGSAPSYAEMQTEQKIAETTGQKRAELAVKDEAGLRSAKMGARPVINAADDIISIVSSNPKYFDLLNSTDMKDAIARTVSRGIQTPGGSIRIDMKDVAAAVQKLPPEDRTAGMLAAQKMLQIQLAFARSFLKGEGQITEGERAIVAQATVDGLDNATAMRLKAEALKMKAEQDEKMYKAYHTFRNANKGATFDDFLDSPQYNSLVDSYEKRLAKVRDANARLLGGSKAPQKKPQGGGSLYNRLLEEGTQ